MQTFTKEKVVKLLKGALRLGNLYGINNSVITKITVADDLNLELEFGEFNYTGDNSEVATALEAIKLSQLKLFESSKEGDKNV